MKREKQVFAILLAAMMLITLSACAGDSTETNGSAANTAANTTESIPETDAAVEETEAEDTGIVPVEDENVSSGFVLPDYKMAIIESNSSFISLAIAFDSSVTTVDHLTLHTSSEDVTFGRCDLDGYYVDPGETGWYDSIASALQTQEPGGVAYSAKSGATPVLVCRYEVSSQVDTDDFYLTSSNIQYKDADGNIQYSKEENVLTVNATIEELPVNPSFAIEGPLICEEGAYYLMGSTTGVSGGTKDGTYYCAIGAELYALNESTDGIHLADIHLIDSRTMETFVLPDGCEIYASGQYKKLGNVSTEDANDAAIWVGISGPEDRTSEIQTFFDEEILTYGLIGYDTDDGLVVYICQ